MRKIWNNALNSPQRACWQTCSVYGRSGWGYTQARSQTFVQIDIDDVSEDVLLVRLKRYALGSLNNEIVYLILAGPIGNGDR